jgi:hypothetical protein
MAAPHKGYDGLVCTGFQRVDRSSRRHGRFGAVPKPVDGRQERALSRKRDEALVARLDLATFRPLGRAPLDQRPHGPGLA